MRTLVAIAAVVLTGCLLDQPYKHDGTTVPEPLEDGWAIATPESVGVDPAALESIHQQLLREDQHFGVLGLLVIKDGKLIFETYTRSLEDRDRLHALQSATKSVTSLVLGAARDRGTIPPLGTPLCVILGDACSGLEPAKQQITLEHLLTMRSGIDFDNGVFSNEMMVDRPKEPLRYILEKPMYAAPGEKFYYRDADPQLVSYALQALHHRTEESLAEEYLFEPLGIREWQWETMPDGASTGAFALHLKARDFARFGQMLLDDGWYGGNRVVSPQWRDLATTVAIHDTGDPVASYGYYFWLTETPKAYLMAGHGGQFVFVVPAQKLVVVQIALPDTSGDDLQGANITDIVELARPLWNVNPSGE